MRACACVRQACISACPEACVVVCLEMCRCVLACLEAREYICARACPCPRVPRLRACWGWSRLCACLRAGVVRAGLRACVRASVVVSVRVRACERACWCLWASLHLLSLSLSLRDRSGQLTCTRQHTQITRAPCAYPVHTDTCTDAHVRAYAHTHTKGYTYIPISDACNITHTCLAHARTHTHILSHTRAHTSQTYTRT
jgi:hypothetical protein